MPNEQASNSSIPVQSKIRTYTKIAGCMAGAFLFASCHGTELDYPEDLAPLHLSPSPGTYADADPVVSIETPDSGVTIKYTTDGTDPIGWGSALVYDGPIHLHAKGVVVLKAYGTRNGTRSPMVSGRYLFPIPWETSASVPYGSLSFRGRTYRTVVVGSGTWMAENLDDAGPSGSTGVCRHDDTLYCAVYGRLYTWAEAMGTSDLYNTTSWGGGDRLRQGVCPSGWHLPSLADWNELFSWVNGTTGLETPGRFLKSQWAWNMGTGVDSFGFRVLPAGYRLSSWEYGPSQFTAATDLDLGGDAIFWTAAEADTSNRAHAVDFPGTGDSIMNWKSIRADGLSVRCVRDP